MIRYAYYIRISKIIFYHSPYQINRLQQELELISIYVLFHKTAQSLLTIAFDSVQQLA